jgi:hypothetical protein
LRGLPWNDGLYHKFDFFISQAYLSGKSGKRYSFGEREDTAARLSLYVEILYVSSEQPPVLAGTNALPPQNVRWFFSS